MSNPVCFKGAKGSSTAVVALFALWYETGRCEKFVFWVLLLVLWWSAQSVKDWASGMGSEDPCQGWGSFPVIKEVLATAVGDRRQEEHANGGQRGEGVDLTTFVSGDTGKSDAQRILYIPYLYTQVLALIEP